MSAGHRNCLSRKDFHLIRISVLGATGKLRELRESLEIAIGEGTCPGEITEALLETYLFAGYPRAINALRALHDTIGNRNSDEGNCSSLSTATEDPAELDRRGLKLMGLVYGKSLPSLLANIQNLHPELAQWMVREGYGKVLSRPGLDVKTRELCVVAILKALGCSPQLEAHKRGAMNAGAESEEVSGAVKLAERLCE